MNALAPHELDAFAAEARASGAEPVLLDVREPWEVALARIERPGLRSLHIPMRAVPVRLEDLPRTQPIVCLCHHGARSAQVVAFLMRAGYENVYNLHGGIDAWSRTVDASTPTY